MDFVVCCQEALKFIRMLFNIIVAGNDRPCVVVRNIIPGSSKSVADAVRFSLSRIWIMDDRRIDLAGCKCCIGSLICSICNKFHIILTDSIRFQHL